MEHSIALLEACKNGKLKNVEELVKKEGIKNVINSKEDGILGYAPIHEAVSAKSYQILEVLLEHGANVNLTADGGYTALHLAASTNAKECIEVLLRQKYNTDLKAVDENGHTPYKRAELNNNKKCSQLIKTAEVKNAVRNDDLKLGKMIASLECGQHVTSSCFHECLDVAVKYNKHFAAGFVILRSPESIIRHLPTALRKQNCIETVAMLLLCFAAKEGDEEMVWFFCMDDQQVAARDFHRLGKGYVPSDVTFDKLNRIRKASEEIDHAFAVSLACNRSKLKCACVILFNRYCKKETLEALWNGLSIIIVSENWIIGIAHYRRLYLNNNIIKEVPKNISILKHLQRLDLQCNSLHRVPASLFELPLLRTLNISSNYITEFPHIKEWSSALKILKCQKNMLLAFPDNVDGALLEDLDLSKNQLEKISIGICKLRTLETLNISENKDLREIPVEFGRLTELKTLTMTGLQINEPPRDKQGSARSIVQYLRAKLRAAVTWNKMKLMLIGNASRGKTTLMNRLRGDRNYDLNIATSGIDIKEIKLAGQQPNNGAVYTFRVWDFAGQEDYYATHQCFLSERSLYLLIFDLSKDTVESLRPWLDNLSARVPYSYVIIIGTWLDQVDLSEVECTNYKDYELLVREKILDLVRSEANYKKLNVEEIVCFSNKVTFCGYAQRLDHLKRKIYEVAGRMEHYDKLAKRPNGTRVMSEKIPLSYTLLEKELGKIKEEKKKRKEMQILTQEEYIDVIRQIECQKDVFEEEDFDVATRFLHNTGTLLHFNDPNQDLKNLYFIDPSWICKLMARVITMNSVHNFIRKGILHIKDLKWMVKEALPPEYFRKYMRLLCRFQICCPLNRNSFLVPSKLTPRPITEEENDGDEQDKDLIIRYHTFAIPYGFWPRLISRLLLFLNELLTDDILNEVLEETENENPAISDSEVPVDRKTSSCAGSAGSAGSVSPPAHGHFWSDGFSSATSPTKYSTGTDIVYFNDVTRRASQNAVFSSDNSNSGTQSSDDNSSSLQNSSYFSPDTFNSSQMFGFPSYDSSVPGAGKFSSCGGFAAGQDKSSMLDSSIHNGGYCTTTTSTTSYESDSEGSEYEDDGFICIRSKSGTLPCVINPLNIHQTKYFSETYEQGLIDEVKDVLHLLLDQVCSETSSVNEGVRYFENEEKRFLNDEIDRSKPGLINSIGTDSGCLLKDSDEDETCLNEDSRNNDIYSFGDSFEQSHLNESHDVLSYIIDRIEESASVNGTLETSYDSRRSTCDSSLTLRSEDEETRNKSCSSRDTLLDETDNAQNTLAENSDKVSTTLRQNSNRKNSKRNSNCFSNNISYFMNKQILTCWKDGLMFRHPDLYFSIQETDSVVPNRKRIVTKVCNTPDGIRVLTSILDHIRTLIKEWFTGLIGTDGRNPLVIQEIPCPLCIDFNINPPHLFDIRTVFERVWGGAKHGLNIVCRNTHIPQIVDVRLLCPELVFEDLPKSFHITKKELKYEEMSDNVIGKGGYGTIYRGKYRGTAVAVKVSNIAHHTSDDLYQALENFQDVRREISILSRLCDNDGIVKLIGFCSPPNLCLVMELAENDSLKKALMDTNRSFSRSLLIQIARQIACGLNFLHTHNIIHRDIKPDNILIFSFDEYDPVNAKLTDFGLADQANLDGMKSDLGTAGYQAPELYNLTDEYSTKVDIFSFAMVVYMMITRRAPYHELTTQHSITTAVKEGERPAYNDVLLSSYGLPSIVDLMTCMWKQDPVGRPQALDVSKQMNNITFQLLFGKTSLEDADRKPRLFCDVPQTREVWVVMEGLKASHVSIIDMNTAKITDTLNFNGADYNMSSYFNIVNIFRVDLDEWTSEIVLVLRERKDILLIFSAKEKRTLHYEVLHDGVHVTSFFTTSKYVFIGFKNGSFSRLLKSNFKHKKLSKDAIITPSSTESAISSIVADKRHLLIACDKYINRYMTDFDPMRMGCDVERPLRKASEPIQDLILSPCGNILFVSFVQSSLIKFYCMRTEENFKIIATYDIQTFVDDFLPTHDIYDRRVSCMSAALDVLWVGTGGGHILLFQITSAKECDTTSAEEDDRTSAKENVKTSPMESVRTTVREGVLKHLFTLKPYELETRNLCLSSVKDDLLMLSSGKKLNRHMFGQDSLCSIRNIIHPPDVNRRRRHFQRVINAEVPAEAPSPILTSKTSDSSVTSSLQSEAVYQQGRVILIWHVMSAKAMRNILERKYDK